jgi:hypothetical protein
LFTFALTLFVLVFFGVFLRGEKFSTMLNLIFLSLISLAPTQHTAGPAIALASTGAGPDQGAAFRFTSEGTGEQPGDFLVRSQVEKALKAKGFAQIDQKPRYLVEVAVTARPLNVGAYEGPPGSNPAWLDKPVAGAPGRGDDHVCEVRVRFVDAMTGTEAYKVTAQQHGPVADCATENFRLVDAALASIPLKR